MDGSQKEQMRWILFWVFVGLFLVVALLTIAAVFFDFGSPSPEERSRLFALFIGEVAGGVLALFYALFRLRSKTASHPPDGNKSISSMREGSDLHEVMLRAQQSLLISGHTLDKFTRQEGNEVRAALETLFKRNVEVTCILVHPDSPYVDAHERFHEFETSGPKSTRKQILDTIDFFRNRCPYYPRSFSVYLSDYKPGFRTIVIDNHICYVNLYMFAKDVDLNPAMRYQNGSPEFEVVRESVQLLQDSPFVVPLVKDGRFITDWQNHAVSHLLYSCLERTRCPYRCERWALIKSVLLANQGSSCDMVPTPGVCDHTYSPGTFTLAQLSEAAPFFLGKNLTYDEWLKSAVRDEWEVLSAIPDCKKALSSHERADVEAQVRRTLDFSPNTFRPLREEIWFQEYTDIIRRILLTVTVGDPDLDRPQQRQIADSAEALVGHSLAVLDRDADLGLADWLRLSVSAGVIGLEHKPDHAATSVVLHEAGIELPVPHTPTELEAASYTLAEALREVIRTEPARDDVDLFFEMVERTERKEGDVRLVSFPDDYIETMFLIHYYGRLLDRYRRLRLTIVPRSLHCANDATADDVNSFIDKSESVKKLINARPPRLQVLSTGPKIGAVNLLKLHPDVVNAIQGAHFLDVRGARNYETMQRIQKDAFFGFVIARTTSEAVTGLNVNNRRFFYAFQRAGDTTFCEEAQTKMRDLISASSLPEMGGCESD